VCDIASRVPFASGISKPIIILGGWRTRVDRRYPSSDPTSDISDQLPRMVSSTSLSSKLPVSFTFYDTASVFELAISVRSLDLTDVFVIYWIT
jgi:hypothetical protein